MARGTRGLGAVDLVLALLVLALLVCALRLDWDRMERGPGHSRVGIASP